MIHSSTALPMTGAIPLRVMLLDTRMIRFLLDNGDSLAQIYGSFYVTAKEPR
jgi:hypothetical protein